MKEPDINIEEKNTPAEPPKKKSAKLKYVLLVCIILAVICGAGVFYLKSTYDEAYLKTLCEKEISAATGGSCKIKHIDWSLSGVVRVEKVSLAFDKGMPEGIPEFLQVEKIKAEIDLLRSLIDFQPVVKLDVSGVALEIKRLVRAGADPAAAEDKGELPVQPPVKGNVDISLEPDSAGQGKFSTNIHDILASVADLPWKEWASNFDWKIADVELRVAEVAVRVHDQSELLQDMYFTLNMSAHLQKTGVDLDLKIGQKTPDVREGGAGLTAKVVFDWDAAASRADKPLAFIGSTDINLTLRDLDTGYLGKYYLQSDRQLLRLAQPVSGNVLITAENLAEVNFSVRLDSKEIVEFFKDDTAYPGGNPSLGITLKARADLSREWSNIKSGSLDILSRNSQTGSELFKLNTQIYGSFGDEIVVSIQSAMNVAEISRSAVGRAFELYNIAQGGLTLGSELTWKKSADWGYELNLRSEDLAIRNDSTLVPAPVDLLLSGIVRPAAQFTPELIEMQLKGTAPGIVLTTGKSGITIPLESAKLSFAGGVRAEIVMPEVFDAFAAPLGKLGLKKIDEKLTLDCSVGREKEVTARIELKNTRQQYAPCIITAAYSPGVAGKFKGSLDLAAEQKAVQVKATVDGTVNSDGTADFSFTKQFAMRVGAGLNLLKRIENIIPGLKVAQYPVAGVVRGNIRGRGVKKGDDISLAASNALLLENMSFTTDTGQKFVDTKTSINAGFSIGDLLGKRILNIKELKVNGDTAQIDCKLAKMELGAFSESVLSGLESIQGLQVLVKFGGKAFDNFYALLGDSIPEALKSGKSLVIEAGSTGDGSINLQRFDLNSTGLQAEISNLSLNPARIVSALAGNDIPAVIAGLSPFKISVKAGKSFWRGLSLPEGLKFSGDAEMILAFEPEHDQLTLSRLILAGDRENRAFVTRVSAALILGNISKLISSPTLPLLLQSLPKGINIPVITVSVSQLAEFIRNNGGELQLRGKTLELSKLRIVNTKEKNTLQLVGNINSSGLALGNMLVYSGSAALNNLIALKGESFGVTGELNLDKAGIKLTAKPYVYNKPVAQPAKLYYRFAADPAGKYTVSRAGMTGGPLQFDLNNLSYEVLNNSKFKFSLDQFKLLAPLALTAQNVVFDPATDQARAKIQVAKTDLGRLNSSLDTGLPTALSGYIGAINLELADKYSTVLGNTSKIVSGGNRLSVEPSRVTLTSLKNKGVNMTLGVGAIKGDTAQGKVTVGSLSITSPTGFSDLTPLQVGLIESTLDLAAIAQGRNIISEVIVSSFKAIYEMKLPTNNITALQKNIDILLPAAAPEQNTLQTGIAPVSAGSPAAASPSVAGGSTVAAQGGGVLIKDLYLNNGVVAIKSKMINTSVSIPQTHVEDIGGSNPRVAFTTVLNVLLRSIGKASLSILDNTAGTAVKSVTNILGNALQNTDKTGSETSAEEIGKNTVKSVTDLVGSFLDNSGNNVSKDDTAKKKTNPLEGLFK